MLAVAALLAVGGAGAGEQEQRLDRLERRVGQVSELLLEVDRLRDANRRLLGRVEELEYRLRRLEEKQRQLYLDLDERITALQGGARKPVAEAPEPGEQAAPSSARPADPARMRKEYDAAYALLQPSKRDYEGAVAAFRRFLEKYPEGELSDNALYWLGEAHSVTGDREAALAAFEALLKRFPESEKVPGALLKKGYLLQAMGREREAADTYRRLLADHPGSPVARLARARLKQLR